MLLPIRYKRPEYIEDCSVVPDAFASCQQGKYSRHRGRGDMLTGTRPHELDYIHCEPWNGEECQPRTTACSTSIGQMLVRFFVDSLYYDRRAIFQTRWSTRCRRRGKFGPFRRAKGAESPFLRLQPLYSRNFPELGELVGI